MIKTFKISKLRNNELLQFFTDVTERCSRFDQLDLKINDVVGILNNEIVQLSGSYNKESGSDITEVLIETDANRDDDIVGIKTVCEGYAYMRDKAKSEAAQLILKSINRHGKSIARLNYQAETLVIDAILKEWNEEPELKAALVTLDLNGWVAMLDAENKKFSDTYQNRLDDKLKSVSKSFSDLRANAINVFRTLSDTIFAYSIIRKNVAYNQLIDAINLIVDDYNAIIERREGPSEQ